MGVSGLKLFFRNDGTYKRCFVKNIPSNISSFFVDCNGVIHKAAGEIYHNPNDSDSDEVKKEKLKIRKKLLKRSIKNLEKLHIQTVIKNFEELINTFKPKDNFVLAIDGLANSAKLSQQKTRRFKKYQETEEAEAVIFDSNSITPGTSFMVKLDEEIEKWLKNYDGYKPKRIIYSSHLSPGEGEHKIFDYIRNDVLVKGPGANVIYGLDNDLIILSVLSKLDNFYLKPEDNTDSVDIGSMREAIVSKLRFPGSDKNIVLQDFSLILTLSGNDFLQKFPNVGSIRNTVPFISLIYSKFLKKPLTDSDNNIIWENYCQFLIYYDNYKLSEGRGQKYIELFLHNPYKIKPYPELGESIIVLNKQGKKVNQVYNQEIHNLQFDEKLFSKKWYQKQFNPDIVQYNLKTINSYSKNEIVKMCVNYLQTVQWVQYYYTKGFKYVSNFQYYHYLYNPLMSSVISVLKILIKDEKTSMLRNVKSNKNNLEITPVHQLMSVLPKGSIELIPEEFRKIYLKELKILNPENFKISDEATSKKHESVAILPPVNINHIDTALREKNFKLPIKLYEKKDIIIDNKK